MGICNKINFYIKRFMEITRKGLLNFYQQASSLIGKQTNHRTNMYLPFEQSDFRVPSVMAEISNSD